MKRFIIVTTIILSFKASYAQPADEIAVRKVLNTQVSAWNSGNIEAFMNGYWTNDSLVFIGKSVSYGWRKTLDNYKKRYPDTVAMGKLSFNLMEFKPISPVYYFVIGQWHLQRSIGNLDGYFTLLFKKINGQWFIIADHSS